MRLVSAILVILLCLPINVHAETYGLHLGTVHSKSGYNDINPGAYVRTKEGYTGGFYYNSENHLSMYAGKQFFNHVMVGVVTGYEHTYQLAVVPNFRVDNVRVFYLPPSNAKAPHAISFAWEF